MPSGMRRATCTTMATMARERDTYPVINGLERLTESLCVGVVLLDSDASLEFANSTAWELLGCASQGELKQRWRELMSRLILSREYLPKGAKPFRFKADLSIHEGIRALELEVYGSEQDACEGYLLLLRDRQTMDSLESELLLASHMRAQPYLITTLIHALADPLNAMQITLELLRVTREEDITPEAGGDLIKRWQHCVTVLDAELARFNRSLQVLRGQGEQWASIPEDVDLCAVTEGIVWVLQHQAQVRHIQLQLSQPKPVVMIRGRREHIKQALLNLMIYAIEAMPSGGQLLAKIGDVDGKAEFVLQDDGPGIPADLVDDIYQIHVTMTKSASGLRLYLARRVVESHGGEMLIETQLGEGARFRLRFPTLQPMPSTHQAQWDVLPGQKFGKGHRS